MTSPNRLTKALELAYPASTYPANSSMKDRAQRIIIRTCFTSFRPFWEMVSAFSIFAFRIKCGINTRAEIPSILNSMVLDKSLVLRPFTPCSTSIRNKLPFSRTISKRPRTGLRGSERVSFPLCVACRRSKRPAGPIRSGSLLVKACKRPEPSLPVRNSIRSTDSPLDHQPPRVIHHSPVER